MRTIEGVSVQRSCVRPWPAVIIATVLGGAAPTGCEGAPDEEVTATSQPALVPTPWSGSHQVPNGTFTESPAISSRGPGSLGLVGRGGDNRYWSASWLTSTFVISRDNGAYTGRQRVRFADDKNFKPTPAAWSWGPGHVDLVGFRQDNTYWINTYQE
jgi:hypothetical protein